MLSTDAVSYTYGRCAIKIALSVSVPLLLWFVTLGASGPAALPNPWVARVPAPAHSLMSPDEPTATPPEQTSVPTPTASPTPSPTLIALDNAGSQTSPSPLEIAFRDPAASQTHLTPRDFANLALDPRAGLVHKTSFFTSVCLGPNLLQNLDYMTPADWSWSGGRKCKFGWGLKTPGREPTGWYTVGGGPDRQPRFFLVPPEAYAQDPNNLKQLSEMHLIVDNYLGCNVLGDIGVTADGVNYQCNACGFLQRAGVCPSLDGNKKLYLPGNGLVLDPVKSGGAYGFLGFPLVVFKKDFSLYYTGLAGYSPRVIYFESAVDKLAPNVDVRTTAEMSEDEVKQISSDFTYALEGTDPKSQLARFEKEAEPSTPTLVLKSKERGEIVFTTTPGAVLSSIWWKIAPMNNQENRQFMETNLCLDMNGEEACFTGVEDFAHCAFYMSCTTDYTSLGGIDRGAYVAIRYFPPGMAPRIEDGKVVVRFQAPDIGMVLEMEVKVRVRDVDPTVVSDSRAIQVKWLEPE